jgi:hypothetical protein
MIQLLKYWITEPLQPAHYQHNIKPKLIGARELSQIPLIPGPFQFGSWQLAPLLM